MFKQLVFLTLFLAHAGCAAEPKAPAPAKATDIINLQPRFDAPPRLATTRDELAKTKAAPDFPAMRDATIAQGETLLKNPVAIPRGYANWLFYYACPDDGATLVMIDLDHHQCPADKKIYTDERTVAAYRFNQHVACENAAAALGWAYAYSGDDKFAVEAKRILLALARDYPNYPARQDRWGNTGQAARLGGRRYVQSLDEAVGIIRLAKGYDLTRTAKTWSDADKSQVEKNLFGLTAATLLEFNQDINNHQTWYNAGLMAIASVTADADLARKVLTMQGGFYDQLKRSIGRDGLWYEGTMSYHSYALQAMIELVDAARRIGLPLQNEPKFKAMILAPLHAAYPDGSFPAINDSDPGNVGQFGGAFEWGWNVTRDPLFAQAMAGGDDKKLAALLGQNAKTVAPLLHSEILPDAGLAILRQGSGANAVSAFLDFGQHGGGHGHYDKLNLMLFANGREWLLDPGRLTYSHKEYKTWVKHSAAHNTVTLGGRSQFPTTGKLLYFQNEKGWSACAATSDGAYFDANLTRHLLLAPQMLVDVFDVESPEETQIDWFAHAIAPLAPVEERGAGETLASGTEFGYQHLTDSRAWQIKGDSRWDFGEKDAPRLRLWLAGDATEQVFSATGIGYHTGQKAPALIRRRMGKTARFVTVYDLSGKADYVRKVEVNKGAAMKIATSEGIWNVSFSAQGAKGVLEKTR